MLINLLKACPLPSLPPAQIARNRSANIGWWLELCCQHVTVAMLTLVQHWTNTKVLTVEALLLAQRLVYNYAATVDPMLCGQ